MARLHQSLTRKVLFYKMRLIVNIYWLWGAWLLVGLDGIDVGSLQYTMNLRMKKRSTAVAIIASAVLILLHTVLKYVLW